MSARKGFYGMRFKNQETAIVKAMKLFVRFLNKMAV